MLARATNPLRKEKVPLRPKQQRRRSRSNKQHEDAFVQETRISIAKSCAQTHCDASRSLRHPVCGCIVRRLRGIAVANIVPAQQAIRAINVVFSCERLL